MGKKKALAGSSSTESVAQASKSATATVASTQSAAQATGSLSTRSPPPVSLTIIYYELRKKWAVPERLLALKMEDLFKKKEFVDEVDSWLNGHGLSEDVAVERNLYPDEKRWQVRKFVEQGGFVAYCPSGESEDHTGLLYRQAQRARQNADVQAAKLADAPVAEEVKLVDKVAATKEEEVAKGSSSSVASSGDDSWVTKVMKMLEEQSTMIAGIKADNAELKADIAGLKADIAGLKADNAGHTQRIGLLESDVAVLNREKACMRTTLNSYKWVLQRKLIETFRTRVASLFQDVQWSGSVPTVAWWREFIEDPRRIQDLSSRSGIAFDAATLARTSYDGQSIQDRAGVAAHVMTEEPEVYATLVCQYDGLVREQMGKIYRFVFGRDAAADAFEVVECCKCPIHCVE